MNKTNFCLQFLDLKSKKKLTNKKAQIINIQSKQTYTETLINGEINLLIDKENIADFYLAYLIAEDKSKHYAFNLAKEFKEEDGKQAPSYTTQKILTPRSYEKSKAKLYFKECKELVSEYEVAIIKCYKVLNDELEKERKKQEGYDYFIDSKDELFVADCEQELAFQAYFYKDLERDKNLANKKRELLDNESAKTCLDLDKVQWCIETKGKQVFLQGNPIFFRPKDLGFENEDTLSIKARLKEETRSFIQKRQVYYKEVFKIDGNLLG
ncbi:hypothetical protein, partial [Campylobacter troglodytis]|uniref:hypothetical protein n=1 Tax=Campylobacter troglodytis TaxID=654363 RepID=UPI00115B465C